MIADLHDIEAQAAEAGFAMREVLAEAGVAPSTWYRWGKGGSAPNLRTWRRIETALSHLRRRRLEKLTQRERAA